MSDLTPITREEMLLYGQDLEPITRKEMFIKRIYDKTQVIPEPITREEIFLKKAGDETTDVTIEQLTATENRTYSEEGVAYSPVIVNVPQTTLTTLDVTENGTYTAPSGTAYNEVEVDVPLPENAYLLKDIPNTPTAIATFSDGANLPMPKLEAYIEPQQDLHGYDNPWVGGAGKNKLQNTLNSSQGVTVNDDGSVVLNGTFTSTVWLRIITNFTLKAGTYTLSGTPQGAPEGCYIYDDNTFGGWTDIGSGSTKTFENDTTGSIMIRVPNGTYNNVKFYPMIEVGSQKTTFAPYSNECPISGWSAVDVSVRGVNVWDEEWEAGGYDVTTGEKIAASGKIRSKNFIPVAPNTNYYVSTGTYDLSSYGLVKCGYDADKNYIGRLGSNYQRLFTTPADCYYITFSPNEYYGDTYNNDISINYPSTDTEYHAYNGHTYTIDLDGTRYGGELDVISGVLTVDRAYVDLGSLSYTYEDTETPKRFRAGLNPPPKLSSELVCSCFKGVVKSVAALNDGECCISGTAAYPWLRLRDDAITDATAFKTAVNGQQLVYELATPTTIQLSPTQVNSLLGVNNVWADCGDIIDGQYFGKEV